MLDFIRCFSLHFPLTAKRATAPERLASGCVTTEFEMGEFNTSHPDVDPLHAIQAMSDIFTFLAAFHSEPASVAKASDVRASLSLTEVTVTSPRARTLLT